MTVLLRLPVTRRLLWWLADHGILRVATEEAFKRMLLRRSERTAAVVRLPAPEHAAAEDDVRPSRSSA